MIKNFMGQDGTYWFIGIVEDNLDPDNNGRVKVRCYGIHSEDKTELPTEHLDWYLTSVSTNSSSSDIATIEIGTCVKGIFLDGIDMQIGLVESIIPGFHTHTNVQRGFANMKSNPPNQGVPTGNPYSRAKNYPERTYYSIFNSASGKTIEEPKGTRQPVFPHNIASMSASGHVIERDDTVGKERVSIQDFNGSYIEMASGGNIVTKAIKHIYNLCVNLYMGITGERVISIGNGDYLKIISGNKVIEIDNGELRIDAKGCVFKINGDCSFDVDGVYSVNSSGGINMETNGEVNIIGSTIAVNGALISLN